MAGNEVSILHPTQQPPGWATEGSRCSLISTGGAGWGSSGALTILSLPPPRRSQHKQPQNFDSFVTTVPARVSQAVQTEAIYRSPGQTFTMTHTGDPRWARRASAEPWIQTPEHKRSLNLAGSRSYPQPPPRAHSISVTLRCRDPRTHTWPAQTATLIHRHLETRRDSDRQTSALYIRTETRDASPWPLQTHARSPRHLPGQTASPPPAPPPKVDKEPNCSISAAPRENGMETSPTRLAWPSREARRPCRAPGPSRAGRGARGGDRARLAAPRDKAGPAASCREPPGGRAPGAASAAGEPGRGRRAAPESPRDPDVPGRGPHGAVPGGTGHTH